MQPGCALCFELVESPHYCQADLARAHKTVCRHNREYAQAQREQLDLVEECAAQPRQGITDLAEWGNWVWAQEQGFTAQGIDLAAVRRASAAVARLTVHQQRELRSVYVVRCEATRVALRTKQALPGEPVQRVKTKLAAFTVAERAYLEATRVSAR